MLRNAPMPILGRNENVARSGYQEPVNDEPKFFLPPRRFIATK
jgi:hypothetical protein